VCERGLETQRVNYCNILSFHVFTTIRDTVHVMSFFLPVGKYQDIGVYRANAYCYDPTLRSTRPQQHAPPRPAVERRDPSQRYAQGLIVLPAREAQRLASVFPLRAGSHSIPYYEHAGAFSTICLPVRPIPPRAGATVTHACQRYSARAANHL